MATILLSAAGAAIGGSIGGSVLGLSAAAAGRFIGASIGRAIDQRVMGRGTEAVETGRVDRLRISGTGEGQAIAQVHGRVKLGGHVIWASNFEEHVTTSGGGGKGAPRQPEVRSYSYSVSLAVALCEGEISGVRRVWADGVELALSDLSMRVYRGTQDQLPDPKMEAVEGPGLVPAYRGTAYVVIEDLSLSRFGNRLPQLSFEVSRPAERDADDLPNGVQAVALLPGSGEYALATEPVQFDFGAGQGKTVNVNSPSGQADFVTSLEALQDELPDCRSVSLIVSWFGDDLRAGHCELRPKVEQAIGDAASMPWQVSGLTRGGAQVVPELGGSPVYGGTPSDQSVVQSIRKLTEVGQDVMFYPFILMDQLAGNGRVDPWGGSEQAALPWRGRITTSFAPGIAGSTDGTMAADTEVATFFGTAMASDFDVGDGTVGYSGPDEWSFRRFILHNAALCAAAGGVQAFCIGSEMRGLTQISGASGFPAVEALRDLAAEVRTLLGPDTKLGYAADWSEYFGYQPQDGSGDVYFHLDPLWSDPNIDFIGIDNYMPLSDWRDEDDHADADWGAIYDLDYLTSNVAGGEGYDWFYPTSDAREAQRREAISDGAHGEDWIYRYKDIRSWWQSEHYNRVSGVRDTAPTGWTARSKPIWFTELGCAAIDKATNQPNKFLDSKSSESSLPRYSNGQRDEFIQWQYLRAMYRYWGGAENNPNSDVYDGAMVDMSRAFVWAWDARPYPWFPNADGVWSDGENYRRGHWITGRLSSRSLAHTVAGICERVGVTDYDVSGLHGVVRGYVVDDVADARQALQPLMLAYGFDAIEREGQLIFRMRAGQRSISVPKAALAVDSEIEGDVQQTRVGEAEMVGRVRIAFTEADGDHRTLAEESVLPTDETHAVASKSLALTLTRAEARQTVERWLGEAQVARDSLKFALPPSWSEVGAGDIVRLEVDGTERTARIDRMEHMAHQQIEAVRIEPSLYRPAEFPDDSVVLRGVNQSGPIFPLFLDLPLMTGDEVDHAPHIAVAARPWPGSVAVYDAPTDSGYGLNTTIPAQSFVGVTQNALYAGPVGVIDQGDALEVRLTSGRLQSISDEAFLAGGNLFAIGDGSATGWELFQARDTTLIAANTWALGYRLRGQAGTDADIPDMWPAGSFVVAMNGLPLQIEHSAANRNVSRHYRIGPAGLSYDDPAYVHQEQAFSGLGLRPYRPAHLTLTETGAGLEATWLRRTRIDGDAWGAGEVPLGEETERYVVRVLQSGNTIREAEVSAPSWTYSSAQMQADALSGLIEVSVAQISARFGAGSEARATWQN